MAANVYYSVSPFGTGDIKTGSPTISISSGVATLSVGQTGNIGQGDRITYNTSSVCYISGVTDSTHFSVVTATGGTPGNVSGQTVNSIAHEYASLSAAEAGATDANHINNTSLVTADVVLNIPCFYDHSDQTEDATGVTINGYTTDATRYINVYTPTGGTQSINSQRHVGKWNTNKYYITGSANRDGIAIDNNYVYITGLQIRAFSTNYYNRTIYQANTADYVYIDKCILESDCQYQAGGDYAKVMYLEDDYGHTTHGKVSNCTLIAKNYTRWGFESYCWSGIFINNTIYGGVYGVKVFYSQATGANYSNNVAVGASTACFFDNGGGWVGNYNASSDTSSPGANSLDNIVASNSFTDSANGDFSLKLGSVLINAGTDLSASMSAEDIIGTARPQSSSWDIGAFEYVVALAFPPLFANRQNTLLRR